MSEIKSVNTIRGRFFYSAKQYATISSLFYFDAFGNPKRFPRTFAKLDSGEIVEYTMMIIENDFDPPYSDSIYLGTGMFERSEDILIHQSN